MKKLEQILYENLLKEDKYDISKDPKVTILLNYLNKVYPEEEYGLADVNYKGPGDDLDIIVPEYHFSRAGIYHVLTDEELSAAEMAYSEQGDAHIWDKFFKLRIGDYTIID